MYGNILKNNTNPLSVSAERIFQSIAIAEYSKNISTDYSVHGSTGAGNNQILFDVAFAVISSKSEIITPIRDEKLSRQQEVEYLQKNGVDINSSKAKYSINKGIWRTSIGGAETLSSDLSLPEEVYPTQLSETTPAVIEIEFLQGEPVGLNGKK